MLVISIRTSSIAYPLDAKYCPMMRVFNAPYEQGDCPLDSIVLDKNNGFAWRHEANGDTDALIEKGQVAIYVGSEDYKEGELYEVRIYASDVLAVTQPIE